MSMADARKSRKAMTAVMPWKSVLWIAHVSLAERTLWYYMYFDRDGGRHHSVGMWWVDVGWSAGGDGWVCPIRFCLLGCRIGVPCVLSNGVLCAIYICLVVEVHIFFICYTNYYILIW